jgi:hypothetical protein
LLLDGTAGGDRSHHDGEKDKKNLRNLIKI